MAIFSAHIKVYGRVQGVFFRKNTFDLAKQHQLTGYVRNLSDGSLEAMFEGEEDSVDILLNWCRHGPPYAKVKNIEILSKGPIEQKKYQFFLIN